MNQLFILYTVSIIVVVSLLFFSYKFTFEKKILKWKEWGLIGIGMVLLTIFTVTYNNDESVNNK